ncbi:sigma factor [Alloalcanivorax xenomutans]|uniref:sigma factor n=1 Tax=Alloalcanivorax xenomutans TaxID=1094342 RepID=UPI003A8053F9
MGATSYLKRDLVAVLYSDHHGWLLGWLRKKLGCSQHAADMAHDTFVRVLTVVVK